MARIHLIKICQALICVMVSIQTLPTKRKCDNNPKSHNTTTNNNNSNNNDKSCDYNYIPLTHVFQNQLFIIMSKLSCSV